MPRGRRILLHYTTSSAAARKLVESAPVNRPGKGNIFILHSQEELRGFPTSSMLLIFVEYSSTSMIYKGILHFRNTVVGWSNGCVVFDGHTIAFLFCVLYTSVSLVLVPTLAIGGEAPMPPEVGASLLPIVSLELPYPSGHTSVVFALLTGTSVQPSERSFLARWILCIACISSETRCTVRRRVFGVYGYCSFISFTSLQKNLSTIVPF